MASEKKSLADLGLVALIAVVISLTTVSMFSLWQSNSSLKVEKQALTASYIRLADILSGVSRKICDEIHEFNDGIAVETVVENCKHIDEIVIELKTIDYLTEEKRLEYNKILIEITDYIFKVARELKDEKVALQIDNLKKKMDREMAIVQNKSVKLEHSNQYLKTKLERIKADKERAISEKETIQQQLFQALRERDEARQKAAELAHNAVRQESLATEDEKIIVAIEEHEIAEEIIEETEKETAIEDTETIKNNASLLPIAENKEKVSYDKIAIRKQLENYLMLLSPKRRDKKLHGKLRDYFANPNGEMISIKNSKYKYTPNNYLNRLTLMGPYDIEIKEIEFDLQGKITKLEVIEVRLER